MPKWFIFHWRILFKYRLYTAISLAGLGMAVSSCWFIANFVQNSRQYDAFHQKADHIYRLTMEVITKGGSQHYAVTGKPLGSRLSEGFSGVRAYARLTFHGKTVVNVNDELFEEKGFFSVNPQALDVFTVDLIRGDRATCFSSPEAVLLSRGLAKKYFNSLDVINKLITIDNTEFRITGVFAEWPENSHLKVKALVYPGPLAAGYQAQDWFNLEHYTYVLLDQASSRKDLKENLEQLKRKELAPILEGSGIGVKWHVQPLKGLYFSPALIDDVPKGNPVYIYGMACAGLLVLLISCLNYLNLSLVQSTRRLKEITLKKILGISAKQFLLQRALESLLMTIMVLLISGILVGVFDHLYFHYTGYHASSPASGWGLFTAIVFMVFLLGIAASGYTGAHYSFSNALANKRPATVNAFKKLLLGLQFAIASVIIIATLIISKQVNYINNKDLGFSREQVWMISLPGNKELKGKRVQFREQVKNYAFIENASLIEAGALPGEENGKDLFQISVDGKRAQKIYNIYRIDENYFELLDIEFAAGRNFQPGRSGDKKDAVIINETLGRSLGWKSPLGKTIRYGNQSFHVIGVVRDFHNTSLHQMIEPIVFIYDQTYSSNLLVRTHTAGTGRLESLWKDFFPDKPFVINYFDAFIAAGYAKEARLAKLFDFFSFVSLLLCCMGLFAVFSLDMLQKRKEMSIRKVLGANLIHLLKTATRRYLAITLLAIGSAIPLAWFFMANWLNGFSYRVEIGPLTFILSAAVILSASGITLAYHVIKILHVNPVDVLKGE